MNEQDKEAFESHLEVICNKENDYERFFAIWQAACEYKQKEIDEWKEAAKSEAQLVNELQEQNKKLKKEIEYLKEINE